MKKNHCTITLLFLSLGILLSSFTTPSDKINRIDKSKINFDTIPYMVNDTYFIQAYDEIARMLEGKDSLSVKRAQFLMEWAYTGRGLDYDDFCHQIDSVVLDLSAFIKMNGIENYKTAGNFALFEYFTKPSPLNGNKAFKYDFKDFAGTEDFNKCL